MTHKPQAIAFILATILSTSLRADLDHIDPVELKAALASSNELFLKHDIPGLMTLLDESHLFVKQDVALKLGRLGAKQAVEKLRQLDKAYAEFACAESGQFGVAVALIENPEIPQQRKALLEIATESRRNPIHTASVIDQAGRELSRFEGNDIEERLPKINTYGAQFTVLALQCRKLSASDAILKCIDVLEQHENPLRAEAAQSLLISIGKPASGAVRELKTRAQANKTIVGRCERILAEVSEG